MTRAVRIDFVSDVVCPWCVIGLRGLEDALAAVGDLVVADIRFQPFELNPQMPREGQDVAEHIAEKYGSTPAQSAANRAMIRDRAAELGFTMAMRDDARIWNTFDAHRLLHWAGLEGRQPALKHALFTAYFTDGADVADPAVLAAAAAAAGLDPAAARAVLDDGRYAGEVRADEAFWRRQGIAAVPAIVLDRTYLISGGQPAAAFERALRTLAAEG